MFTVGGLVLLPALLLLACASDMEALQHKAQRHHIYIRDIDQYGVEDLWVASLKGDCEDYALWVRERVGGDLLMVRTQEGEMHMVLRVDDYIFDSLSTHLYKFEDMPHKYIATIPYDKHTQN
jgi:predicted transglutaminase-like cysteine proteinase